MDEARADLGPGHFAKPTWPLLTGKNKKKKKNEAAYSGEMMSPPQGALHSDNPAVLFSYLHLSGSAAASSDADLRLNPVFLVVQRNKASGDDGASAR